MNAVVVRRVLPDYGCCRVRNRNGPWFRIGWCLMNALRAMFVSVLLVQPGAVLGDSLQPPPGAPEEAVATSARELEIRQLLGVLLEQGTATVLRVGESFLPEEPKPGLQFNIDPDSEEVYVGWRFQF